MVNKKLWISVATLTGTIMGAGFLGIPYVISKSGFFIGIAYILFLGFLLCLTKLYLGEVTLRTKGKHQLSGYAEKYLGKPGKVLMICLMIFGIYSALIAYIIAEGESISFILFGTTQYSLLFGTVFWILMSVFVYKGLKALKKGELFGMLIVMLLFLVLTIIYIPKVDWNNLMSVGRGFWFLPFGVVMFAFLGFSAMPAVRRELSENEKLMKRTILIGMLIPAVFYTLFTIVVIGISDGNVPEIATFSLGGLFIFLGIITLFTAFLSLSVAIKDTYRYDLKINHKASWALATIIPYILFLGIKLLNIASFIDILSFGGVISGGLSGILIVLMAKNAKKKGDRKPEYTVKINWWIVAIICAIFIIGAIMELIYI
jgi:amino acid permease